MKLRILPETGDGPPIGTMGVVEGGFEYLLDGEAPHREAVEEVLKEVAVRETRPAYGGADDPDSACGGYGRVPATEEDKMKLAVKALSSLPVRLEGVEE